MRPITKLLFSTCAVCAVAQGGVAFAQSASDPTSPSAGPSTSNPTPMQNDPSASPSPSNAPSTAPVTNPAPSTTDPSTAPNPGDPMANPSTAPVSDTSQPIAPPPAPDDATTPPATAPSPNYTMDETPDSMSYGWHEPRLASGIGISAMLGGGVVGFTDRTMRATTSDVGGLWDLRVTLGSHLPIALDISYLGSATSLNGLPSGQSGNLIGTTVEGDLRYNILPHAPLTPYVFAGMGWTRYDVTDAQITLADSGINNHDNLLEFPLGAGVAWRRNGLVADVRGTFRAAAESNLVLVTPNSVLLGTNNNNFAAMHTWEASAAIGYEF